jgi:hypothetical protein
MTKKQKFAKYAVFAAIGIAIGAGVIGLPKLTAYIERLQMEQENEDVMTQIIDGGILENTIESIAEIVEEEQEENIVILENAYLEVPFVCQAPLETEANWVFHEESCEEAALLQVKYYLDGIKEVDKQKANDTILDMIKWANTKICMQMK